jgi:membrane protein DedA with SNARE-associated domain
MQKEKVRFVLSNILKGILWICGFLLIYLLGKRFIDINFFNWLEPLFNNTSLILIIFLSSEIVIGIIPPEVFIIWALRHDQFWDFLLLVGFLAIISYLAGVLGYIIGMFLNRSLFYRFLKRRFLHKLDIRLQIFGQYLIIIAALTPVPFSGVSMLVGSVKYPFRKYVLLALTRFLRFAIYAIVFWEANINF